MPPDPTGIGMAMPSRRRAGACRLGERRRLTDRPCSHVADQHGQPDYDMNSLKWQKRTTEALRCYAPAAHRQGYLLASYGPQAAEVSGANSGSRADGRALLAERLTWVLRAELARQRTLATAPAPAWAGRQVCAAGSDRSPDALWPTRPAIKQSPVTYGLNGSAHGVPVIDHRVWLAFHAVTHRPAAYHPGLSIYGRGLPLRYIALRQRWLRATPG